MLTAILGRYGTLPTRERFGMPFAILILLVFVGVGIDTIIHPKRHMNSYLRSGGEMRRELNETCIQFVGLAFSCVSGWILYELVWSVWVDCFR
jgi:hypothetical protein